MESPTERVAAEVRAEMGRQKVTTPTLAHAADMSPTTLWRKLHGRSPITVPDLIAIAHALGLTASDFIARADLDGAA